MLKKAIYFSNPAKLSLKNNQLIVEYRDTDTPNRSVPIEDLGYVIIVNNQISLTIPLMNALVDNNTSLIICGNNQMPHSMLQPLEANTVQAEVYRAQIEASLPLKKNLWKQIIEAKIKNQSKLLNKLGKDGNLIVPYYRNVKSGDSDNKEGAAARIYWKQLFGEDFIRNRDGGDPNAVLNYGYAILRAAVARALMGSGLSPAFGIFHRNRYNAFPLADDIMEPYRPFVDECVYNILTLGECELNTKVKSELVKVLFCDTYFPKMKRPLDVALSMTTASLVKCFSGEVKSIVYPSI